MRNPRMRACSTDKLRIENELNTDQNRSYVNNNMTYKQMTSTQETTVDLQNSQQELIQLQELQTRELPHQNEDLPNNRGQTQIGRRNPESVPVVKKRKDKLKATRHQGTNTTIPTEPKENLPTRPTPHSQPQSILQTT